MNGGALPVAQSILGAGWGGVNDGALRGLRDAVYPR